MNDLTGSTAVVTGASRGFGRGVAMALAQSGLKVVALARSGEALEDLSREAQAQQARGIVVPVEADVAEADVAERVLSEYRPQLLVLVAGASPHLAPLPSQSWEGFSRNWHVDVKQSLHWLQAALALPLAPGSTVLVFSSGAALRGSPMSGGYAGAKATQAFINPIRGCGSRRPGAGAALSYPVPHPLPYHRSGPRRHQGLRRARRHERRGLPGADGAAAHLRAGERAGARAGS